MEANLDYLSLRYTIRLHFLPVNHTLGPPRGQPNTHTSLPGLHHLYNLSKHLVLGKLEDQTMTDTVEGVVKTTSPNPDKTTRMKELHEKWLQTYLDHTIIIYTDGSKLDSGAVFICIDNQATINTLQSNQGNHEYVRRTVATITTLQLLGWWVSTVWCPSHSNIPGNEKADTGAKMVALSTTPCRFATTTKCWLLTQARKEFLEHWKMELPYSCPSFKFPSHLHGIDWANTRALWRVFCIRKKKIVS